MRQLTGLVNYWFSRENGIKLVWGESETDIFANISVQVVELFTPEEMKTIIEQNIDDYGIFS